MCFDFGERYFIHGGQNIESVLREIMLQDGDKANEFPSVVYNINDLTHLFADIKDQIIDLSNWEESDTVKEIERLREELENSLFSSEALSILKSYKFNSGGLNYIDNTLAGLFITCLCLIGMYNNRLCFRDVDISPFDGQYYTLSDMVHDILDSDNYSKHYNLGNVLLNKEEIDKKYIKKAC